MHSTGSKLSTERSEQVFKFLIRDESVTRTTVTIFAEDLDVAWNRVRDLFPGSDLSDTEVQQADQISIT